MTPHTWLPDHAHHRARPPEPGQLVAWDHRVWRVVEVKAVPETEWTDRDRRMVSSHKPAYRATAEPVMVVLRPVEVTTDDVRARDHDRHLRHSFNRSWNVYPDEHYPVCVMCGEPTPCRDRVAKQHADREVEQALDKISRYETPGVCPACAEPVTRRQKTIVFDDNLEIPGGPPVTFHLRGRCFLNAVDYERRWAAIDPDSRGVTLAPLPCTGWVTNHNDGTYECTAEDACTGPVADHDGFASCDCPGCNDNGRFHCRPARDARQRNRASQPHHGQPDLFGGAQ